MRKLIVSEFVSLDGVVEDPSWTFQFGSEEQEKFIGEAHQDVERTACTNRGTPIQ